MCVLKYEILMGNLHTEIFCLTLAQLLFYKKILKEVLSGLISLKIKYELKDVLTIDSKIFWLSLVVKILMWIN